MKNTINNNIYNVSYKYNLIQIFLFASWWRKANQADNLQWKHHISRKQSNRVYIVISAVQYYNTFAWQLNV